MNKDDRVPGDLLCKIYLSGNVMFVICVSDGKDSLLQDVATWAGTYRDELAHFRSSMTNSLKLLLRSNSDS